MDILDPEMNMASDDEDEESYVEEEPAEVVSPSEITRLDVPRENSSG